MWELDRQQQLYPTSIIYSWSISSFQLSLSTSWGCEPGTSGSSMLTWCRSRECYHREAQLSSTTPSPSKSIHASFSQTSFVWIDPEDVELAEMWSYYFSRLRRDKRSTHKGLQVYFAGTPYENEDLQVGDRSLQWLVITCSSLILVVIVGCVG